MNILQVTTTLSSWGGIEETGRILGRNLIAGNGHALQFSPCRVSIEKMGRMDQEIAVQHKTKNLPPH